MCGKFATDFVGSFQTNPRAPGISHGQHRAGQSPVTPKYLFLDANERVISA